MPDSTITLRTKADTSGIDQTINALRASVLAAGQSEVKFLELAGALAKQALAAGDAARADAILENANRGLAAASIQATGAQVQLNQTQQEGSALAAQFGAAFKSNLLGIVGPAALVTAGFTAAKAAADSFVDAFKFKAQLDQNIASINAQLKGVRDTDVAFREAAVFADRYKLTQEETTTAIQLSIPLLRQSRSSLTDVLTVLQQLSVVNPDQGLKGAAFALAELESGQARSLATRFRIPINAANEMKREIQGGADAVQVLGKYLDAAGISSEALEVRTKGAAGALNNAAVAAERLKLAQASIAAGPGVAVTNVRADVTNLAAGELANDTKATAAFTASLFQNYGAISQVLSVLGLSIPQLLGHSTAHQQAAQSVLRAADADDRAAQASQLLGSALSDDAKKKLDSSIASAQLAQEQAQLEKDSALAAQGLLGAGDQALILAQKYGIAADQAQFLITQQQRLSNATALADQRVGERDPSNRNTAAEQEKFGKIRRSQLADEAAERKKNTDKAAADAARLNDLRNQNRLINARTSDAKIAELEREKAATNDVIKRQEIQNQIDQERQSKQRAGAAGGKGLGALDRVDISLAGDYQAQLDAVNARLREGNLTELQRKQLLKDKLDLEEKIANEQERQVQAALDARIAAIENRKKDREDQKRLAAANAVLNNPNAFNAEQRANAADLVELLPLEKAKRDRDAAAKAREGGVDIGVSATAIPVGNAANAPGGANAPVASLAGAGAGGTPLILQMDSKQVGSILLPVIIQGLQSRTLQVQAAGG